MASNRILNSAEFFFFMNLEVCNKKKVGENFVRMMMMMMRWFFFQFDNNSTVWCECLSWWKDIFSFSSSSSFLFCLSNQPQKCFETQTNIYILIDRFQLWIKKTRQNIIIIRIGNHLFFPWAFIIIITWFIRLGNFFLHST